MSPLTLTVHLSGAPLLISALRGLSGDVEHQDDALDLVADLAQAEVRRRTPRASGALAADTTAERIGQRVVIYQGQRLAYAGPVNYGYAARNIAPSHHLQDADTVIEPRAFDLIDTNTDRLIAKRGLT